MKHYFTYKKYVNKLSKPYNRKHKPKLYLSFNKINTEQKELIKSQNILQFNQLVSYSLVV